MVLCLEALAYSFAEDFVEILVPFSVDGVDGLVAGLLNGGGLRLMEALGLRMKDLDGEMQLVTVRSGQGDKHRNTLLPHSLLEPHQHQLRQVRKIHQRDRAAGWGRLQLPHALAKTVPNAGRRAVTTWMPPWSRRRCAEPCWPPESPNRPAATAM